MIGIVDYGRGNLLSVLHALEMVGADTRICPEPEQLEGMDRLVLPGVGAFRSGMDALRRSGMAEALERFRRAGRPILGICLGMQLMARRGHEGGGCLGLGWFDAEVERIRPAGEDLRVPQVGWNDTEYRDGHALFEGFATRAPEFYYVHSYRMRCRREEVVVAICDHGGRVTAAVCRDNVVATQFHPEKSQDHGLRLLENFVGWRC